VTQHKAHTTGAELSATEKQHFYMTFILYDSSISSHKKISISVGNLEDVLAIDLVSQAQHHNMKFRHMLTVA